MFKENRNRAKLFFSHLQKGIHNIRYTKPIIVLLANWFKMSFTPFPPTPHTPTHRTTDLKTIQNKQAPEIQVPKIKD